ncbi:TCP-1/cpn60 chaperonin family protein [Candidatus Woesearchaeota archaeon]|nr:TCP-1/cpn60 chaperonin family protein [Candidatus Woesearchaeota archaeon]
MNQQIQPIFILPEGSQRTTGKDAQRNNIAAAKAVAETVRTTLGPKGMDKMLVDSMGDVVVTNDGVTILEEMQIEHPTAKMIVEVAKTQESEVGDGTTTAVVLAGTLLKNAEELLDDNIHPTIIAKGYRMASEKSQEILNELAEKIDEKDDEILKRTAITAMTGKGAEGNKDVLSDLAVKAVRLVKDEDGVDLETIRFEKKTGDKIENSELIMGIVMDKERVHNAMPKKVKDAKIALLDAALEIKGPESDTKIEINDPRQLEAFIDREERTIKDMIERVKASGANVVICQKGIDDLAQHYLAKSNIYAVRRVKKSDLDNLARATGAKVVNNIKELSSEDLGYAGLVEELKVGDELMTYVRECKNPKAVTILLRGGTQHVVDEIERAMKDAIGDIAAMLKSGKAVAGAGATEIELAKRLRKYANSLSGKEQLAVLAFAEAMEVIPRTLAENAGLDPVDIVAELKSRHDQPEGRWAGINVFTGKIMDAWEEGVIEPLKIKTQAVASASEVTELILRIDDVIASSGSSKGNPAGRMPHPEMDGMM